MCGIVAAVAKRDVIPVLLEGLAQTFPLFVAQDDEALITRVRIDHYIQLVRSELHLMIDGGHIALGVSPAQFPNHHMLQPPSTSSSCPLT